MATYATAIYDTAVYDDAAAVYTAGVPFTDTPLPHVRVLWRPEQFTRITNPGFETNATGWSVAAGINAAGTSITRITTDHQSGSACGQLVTTATNGSGVNFDLGGDRYFSTSLGCAYVAVVWLKRVSGATKAKLILGSKGTSSDRAELDINLRDKWTPYRVVWISNIGRTDVQLAITNGYAAALTVKIDTVSLYQLDAFSQVENGNFVVGTNGWDSAGTYIAGAASSLTRVTSQGMDPDNQTCGQLVTTTTSGSGASYPLGIRLFTNGRTYRLRVAVRNVSGDTACRLRLGSIGTASDRGDSTVTLTTDWQIFQVDWTPSANRTDACLALSNGSAVATTVQLGFVEVYEALDDVSSPYLMAASWKTGSEAQGPRTPPGTITVTLNDSSKRFFPQNSSSPLAGSIVASRRIWGRATYQGDIFPLFYGTIDKIVPDGDGLVTTITAKDPLDDIASIDYEAGFTENLTYADVRAIALGSLPATRQNLSSASIEGSYFFSGNESQKLLSVLEAMNEATGTLHFVKPHTMAEMLWQYTTIDRPTLTDSSVSAETINDDFADLGGIQASSDGLENHQFVPWQSYERGTAPDGDVTGFGAVVQAVDISAYAGGDFLDFNEDPYLHYRDPAFGTDDNVPEPTFERITRRNKKGRKKVRRKRIYPDPFVPFTMAAGDVLTYTFDFSIPMSGTVIAVSGPTGAANIITSIVESYPRHIVFQLFAAADDTIDYVAVNATPWQPLDEQTSDVSRWDSIANLAEFEGPSIQSPFIGSAGMADGLGAYRNWRYGVSRIHPALRVENRFSSGIQRSLGQHVTVTSARWGLSSLPLIVVGCEGQMDTGARSWNVTYNLEECPTGGPWFTLGNAARGLGAGILAH